jgi:hypothetical protein
MDPHLKVPPPSRREALRRMGGGMGMVALANMVGRSIAGAATNKDLSPEDLLKPRKGHYEGKVEHVIFLFMNGGCSSIDSFDHKPELEKHNGKPLPGGEVKTERKTGNLLASPFSWKTYGQAGIEYSELWPHLGECADDICQIRSMYTDIPNHEPSLLMMNTGHNQPGRPSMGAWLTYGLGTENQNLPGFVVLCPDQPTVVGPPLWSNGFLPAVFQGTFVTDKVEHEFDPYKLIPYIKNEGISQDVQRRELDLLGKLNRFHLDGLKERDPQLESTIQSMETAFRMQTEAPEVFDIRKETEATQKLYGPGSTARGCLTAARLIEKGVRMVQVYYAKGDPWDAHDDILKHRKNARDSDQPFAALIKDLKGRGLWDKTLIVCGTEFGRTPVVETGGGGAGGRVVNGRDHNPFGFTVWLAGGAVKGGYVHGRTDDFGFKTVEKPVHVHDLHATILHLMGIDHTRLTYHYSGRDFRLTDVHGNVVKEILA